MQTVGMAIIARDVEKTIEPCINSFASQVEQIVVVEAGKSTDRTHEILLELQKKDISLDIYEFDWIDDFSAARNFSFSKLRTDWGCWCDADDVIVNPEKIRYYANNLDDKIGAVWFPYDYCLDEFGNVTTRYERERLLRLKYAWAWRSRIHETVSPLIQCQYVRTNEVYMVHNHTTGKERGTRNFKLLNMMLKEDPDDKRIWLYLGHQHFAAMEFLKAAEWYLKFGTDLNALPLERFQALCYCSKALRGMKDNQALDVAMQAISLFPEYKDGYLEAAHSHLMMENYDRAIHFANLSDIKDIMQEPPSIIFINPMEYTHNRYALMAECYLKKNELEKSLEWAKKVYETHPSEQERNNLIYIQNKINREKISDGIKMLAVDLVNNKETIKLQHLKHATPSWFRDTEEYFQLEQGVVNYTDGIKSDPAIYKNGKECVINVSTAFDLKELLREKDKEYEKIKIISTAPNERTKQFNYLTQGDMERLIITEDNRHIINMRTELSRVWCEYDHKIPAGMLVKFYCGQGVEYWSPETIRIDGCGGSETAVAMVAKELALLGHQPIIYAMDNQVWDGVMYRSYDKFKMPDCDWFISSRIPELYNNKINATSKWLYVHDIHCFNRLTPENASEIDVIIALSQWHVGHLKRTYPFLKDAEVIDTDKNVKTYDDLWTPHTFYEDAFCRRLPKIAIIGNGIDITRFENLKIDKKPHSFIWCSSPDRGLEEVLNLWPLIRKELPDATLKIFYGWNYFDSTLHIQGQREFKEKIRVLIKQDGVEWCDRIGQVEIAHELAKAQCMLYPPPHQFRETYGIAFLEAQAAGVICFYRENGALGETIGNRGIALTMDMKPDEIVAFIVTTLKDENMCADLAKRGREYALQRTWAKQTEKMLKVRNNVPIT